MMSVELVGVMVITVGCCIRPRHVSMVKQMEMAMVMTIVVTKAKMTSCLQEWGTTGKISLNEYGGSVAARCCTVLYRIGTVH